MRTIIAAISFLLLLPYSTFSQEITETNTDKLYKRALNEYRESNYQRSLEFTSHALKLAPEYHDIRILEIRNLWALKDYDAADKHLEFLLKKASGYVDVNPLVHQRISRFQDHQNALDLIYRAEKLYPDDFSLQVKKAQILLKTGQRSEARKLAQELNRNKDISGQDRYALETILNRTVRNEIGVNYSYINFSEAYRNYDNWHTISAEFQHNLNRTAVIGRINYSEREISSGSLYEVEAYPVFSEKAYGFVNAGFSNGSVFPKFRSSASFYYNFAKILEGELGGRILHFDETSYFSGIIGLTAYHGNFYFNARTFLGPRRLEEFIQMYQFNVRYYLKNADNYLFAKLGSGISPDERTDYTRIEYPELQAYYLNAGINKTLGSKHIFKISAGFLVEDVSGGLEGNQLIASFGYRYRL